MTGGLPICDFLVGIRWVETLIAALKGLRHPKSIAQVADDEAAGGDHLCFPSLLGVLLSQAVEFQAENLKSRL